MKILFVTKQDYHGVPNGGSAGSKRNFQLLSELADVDLYHIKTRKNLFAYLSLIFMYFPGITLQHIQEINQKCKDEKYSAIFLDASLFGGIAKNIKRKFNCKVVVFFHNCESDYFKMLSKKNIIKSLYYLYALFSERQCTKYADIIITLNRRDQKRIAEKYLSKSEYLIPVTFEDKFIKQKMNRQKQLCNEPVILFVGSFFLPNYEGVKWFIENALPLISAKLQIVGKGFEKVKYELEALNDKLEVIGTVQSIEPYYTDAACVVMPIFEGSGMKVKMAEALMYGKTVFGTKEAFEGYEIDCQKAGGLCNTGEEFVTAMNQFLKNPVYYNSYNRQIFMEKYSNSNVKTIFEEILREVST